MPPLTRPQGYALPLEEQLRQQEAAPSFTIGETLAERVPQDLKDTFFTGTAIKETMVPPLAKNLTKPAGRYNAPEYTFKTDYEVLAEGDTLYNTEDEYRKSPYYNSDVKWERGMTERRAKALFDLQNQKRIKELYSQARPIVSAISSLGTQLLDPPNWIPVLGEATLGTSVLGRVAAWAIEGGVANLVSSAVTANTRNQYDKNEGTVESVAQDAAMGVLLGPVFGGMGAGARLLWRKSQGVRNKVVQNIQQRANQLGQQLPGAQQIQPQAATPTVPPSGVQPIVPPLTQTGGQPAATVSPPVPIEQIGQQPQVAFTPGTEKPFALPEGEAGQAEKAARFGEKIFRAPRTPETEILSHDDAVQRAIETYPEGTSEYARFEENPEANLGTHYPNEGFVAQADEPFDMYSSEPDPKVLEQLPPEGQKRYLQIIEDHNDLVKKINRARKSGDDIPFDYMNTVENIYVRFANEVMPYMKRSQRGMDIEGTGRLIDMAQGFTIASPDGTVNSNFYTQLENSQNVMVSRLIFNDAADALDAGKDPQISEASKAAIMETGPLIHRQLEIDRTELKRKENEEKRTAAARQKIEQLNKEITKQDKKIAYLEDRPGHEADQAKAIEKRNQAEADLRDTQAEISRIRSERYGYKTDAPKMLEGFDYTSMQDYGDLPIEIVARLPENVKRGIDQIIANAKRTNRMGEVSQYIKWEIAPYMGDLYAGTYGYLFHGTSRVYDNFDPNKLGFNTEAKSAGEAYFFGRSPDTANNTYYTGADKVSYDPERSDLYDFDKAMETYDDALKDHVADAMKGAKEELRTATNNMVSRAVDVVKLLEAYDAKKKTQKLTEADQKSVKKLKIEKTKLKKTWKKTMEDALNDPDVKVNPNVRPSNVTLKNPYVYDYEGKIPFVDGGEKRGIATHILKAKQSGNDGVIFLNLSDGGNQPDMIVAVLKGKEDQIESALELPKPVDWSPPPAQVEWKTTITDLEKMAKQFSKPMDPVNKFDAEMKLEGIDPEKLNGIGDPELDRMDIEAAKAGMSEAEARAFDEALLAMDDELASDDRITKAEAAVEKCRST